MPNKNTFEGRKILIVEDDYMVVLDLLQRLVMLGADIVGPASSNEQALRLIEGTPTLGGAILDLKVAGEMSFPIADVLLEQGIRFVFVTGLAEAAIPKRFSHVPFCNKPASVLDIVQALSN